MDLKNNKIALLIDGDNAQATNIKNIIDIVSTHGHITIKRVYDDWSRPQSVSWANQIQEHALKPIQKFAYVKGKNATDIILIIDAMEILYTGNIDGFCIVSSDSDFTGLASKIKENGKFVIGVGKHHTPIVFTNTCDLFIYSDEFKPKIGIQKPIQNKKHIQQNNISNKKQPSIKQIRNIYRKLILLDDKVSLGTLIKTIKVADSSFSAKKYGYKTSSLLISSLKNEFKLIKDGNSSYNVIDLKTMAIKE